MLSMVNRMKVHYTHAQHMIALTADETVNTATDYCGRRIFHVGDETRIFEHIPHNEYENLKSFHEQVMQLSQ
jgi:hypothetical protein